MPNEKLHFDYKYYSFTKVLYEICSFNVATDSDNLLIRENYCI